MLLVILHPMHQRILTLPNSSCSPCCRSILQSIGSVFSNLLGSNSSSTQEDGTNHSHAGDRGGAGGTGPASAGAVHASRLIYIPTAMQQHSPAMFETGGTGGASAFGSMMLETSALYERTATQGSEGMSQHDSTAMLAFDLGVGAGRHAASSQNPSHHHHASGASALTSAGGVAPYAGAPGGLGGPSGEGGVGTWDVRSTGASNVAPERMLASVRRRSSRAFFKSASSILRVSGLSGADAAAAAAAVGGAAAVNSGGPVSGRHATVVPTGIASPSAAERPGSSGPRVAPSVAAAGGKQKPKRRASLAAILHTGHGHGSGFSTAAAFSGTSGAGMALRAATNSPSPQLQALQLLVASGPGLVRVPEQQQHQLPSSTLQPHHSQQGGRESMEPSSQ